MKKIFILAVMIVIEISQLYAQEFTYKVKVPLEIDAIPNNQIVKNGRTYTIRYYLIEAYIYRGSTGVVLEHLGIKKIPVSSSGIHNSALVFSKTFDHKLDGNRYGIQLKLCEDSAGNTCIRPEDIEVEEAQYSASGTLTKL
jgi:hypothetical protein